jgi:succinoglycan biosynthesis protein ExoM
MNGFPHSSMPTATIAIITCRRPEGLTRLLETLACQKTDAGTELDILVVDNACQDKVKNLVQELTDTCPFPICYEQEPRSGIVHARNKCISYFLESDSEFLLFIDDDEWPESETWAQDMLRAQSRHQTDIVASRVASVGEPGTPDWALQLMYGKNRMQEGQSMPIFYTGNLLIRRNVLEAVQPAFDERFAMTGASDYHFALKCLRAGFKAVYTDAPVLEEFPKDRARIKWFVRRGFRSGIGYTRSHLFEEGLWKTIARCLVMSVLRFGKGILNLFAGILTVDKTRFVDGLFRLASTTGTLVGFLGIKYNEYQERHKK